MGGGAVSGGGGRPADSDRCRRGAGAGGARGGREAGVPLPPGFMSTRTGDAPAGRLRRETGARQQAESRQVAGTWLAKKDSPPGPPLASRPFLVSRSATLTLRPAGFFSDFVGFAFFLSGLFRSYLLGQGIRCLRLRPQVYKVNQHGVDWDACEHSRATGVKPNRPGHQRFSRNSPAGDQSHVSERGWASQPHCDRPRTCL